MSAAAAFSGPSRRAGFPVPNRLLVVDDNRDLLELLEDVLEQAGYAVRCAASAREARSVLLQQPVDLVMTDYQMPEESGAQFLRYVRDRFPDLPVLVITGESSTRLACDLIRSGADDFVPKPFRIRDLERTIAQCLARRERDRERSSELTRELAAEAISALAAAVDAKDGYTADHSERVTQLARRFGESLELEPEQLLVLEAACRMHDVGKIGVPEAVLNKEGRLDETDWHQIRRHPQLSADIVGRVGLLHDVAQVVRHHHERVDGSGYPDGLRGEEIPYLSRVLAVVDAFDALTSDRAYRRAFTGRNALEVLRHSAGTQFDATLVERFIRMIEGGPFTSGEPFTAA